jgi:hypothetical protein
MRLPTTSSARPGGDTSGQKDPHSLWWVNTFKRSWLGVQRSSVSTLWRLPFDTLYYGTVLGACVLLQTVCLVWERCFVGSYEQRNVRKISRVAVGQLNSQIADDCRNSDRRIRLAFTVTAAP